MDANDSLMYRVHPALFPAVLFYLQQEGISFKIEYRRLIDPVCFFEVYPARAFESDKALQMIEEVKASSDKAIRIDNRRQGNLASMGNDYEKIKTDMNALIMALTLRDAELEPSRRRSVLFTLLHSQLSSALKKEQAKKDKPKRKR